MLNVKNVSKQFSSGGTKVIAVDDISLHVPEGYFVSIIGRSGSGKSTLLALLGALDKPTSGDIEVDGKKINKMNDHTLIKYRCNKIGFVFQNYNLVPNLTAIENVMLPMEFAGVKKPERKKRAIELLDQVGLSAGQQKRKPGRLSGGEQQRVAIARALANRPKLILADEPTGNLDSHTGKVIFDMLHSLAKSEKTTIVAVTHDLSIAGKTDMSFHLLDGKLVDSKKIKA
ncbi:MAG TPA: ABC transporter ATP-binding protein [Patescibacteria group bacterium]|jgi:putative ABC transport system ATP-binding protein|nr:ABC transporter ATP-binding protein [Patescibacteria group bacterium]